MRRASTLAVAAFAATGGVLFAGAVSAQSAGGGDGQRYLTWQARGEVAAPAPAVAPAASPGSQRRPNTVIPHGGFASAEPPRPRLTPAPGPVRRSLTPATAWLQPAAPAPVASAPEPVTTAPPVARTPQPRPRPAAVPEYLPDQGGRGQPVPAEVMRPAPAVIEAADTVTDPMAPRRDAPIFRMQQATPPAPQEVVPATPQAEASAPPRRIAEVASSGEQPPQQGARYYSVHRQNGREPDPLVMPAPTYVDALVVSMADTPATEDLAEPAQGPTLIRDRNGNMRATPAASDGDHQ